MKHRYTTSIGVDFIMVFEKCILKPYDDGYGFMTIGYGHLIKRGEEFKEITKEQAGEILKKDLFRTELSVLKLINIALTDNQFDALISFTFNLGGGALQRSNLRMKINRADNKEETAQEFLKWTSSAGRKSNGLLRRRISEMRMFLS